MYKGCHATLDIINFFLPAREGGEKILKILKESLKFSSCHAVHEKLVVLGETSPPGFTSVILIDESHLTAHCYSEEGLLAIDAFTCGKSDPEKMIDFIYNEILKLDNKIIVVKKHILKRFPYNTLNE